MRTAVPTSRRTRTGTGSSPRRAGSGPGSCVARPGAGDRDAPLLHRLAQRLEDVAVELGQLIEEEHSLMGQSDFAGRQMRARRRPCPRTRSCGAGARNGGRRRSSRRGPSPAADATTVAVSAAASSSGGNNPGIVRARSVLPEPGGPIEQQAVATGQRDLEPASRMDLPADLAQVGDRPTEMPRRPRRTGAPPARRRARSVAAPPRPVDAGRWTGRHRPPRRACRRRPHPAPR